MILLSLQVLLDLVLLTYQLSFDRVQWFLRNDEINRDASVQNFVATLLNSMPSFGILSNTVTNDGHLWWLVVCLVGVVSGLKRQL